MSYRNLVVYRGRGPAGTVSPDTRTTPPHDLTDKSVLDDYPRGPGSDLLNRLMSESVGLFAEHPVNVARRAAEKPPATNVWLWGLGSTPHLTPFAELYGKQGAMITAVDLLRGLATLIGWRRIEVPGATGYLDTDYAAKGRYAVAAMRGRGSGMRSRRGDRRGIARRRRRRQGEGPGRDRPAYCRAALRGVEEVRRVSHSGDARASHAAADEDPRPRQRAVCDGRQRHRARAATVYDDPTAEGSPLKFDEGWRLMGYFLASPVKEAVG